MSSTLAKAMYTRWSTVGDNDHCEHTKINASPTPAFSETHVLRTICWVNSVHFPSSQTKVEPSSQAIRKVRVLNLATNAWFNQHALVTSCTNVTWSVLCFSLFLDLCSRISMAICVHYHCAWYICGPYFFHTDILNCTSLLVGVRSWWSDMHFSFDVSVFFILTSFSSAILVVERTY